MPQDFFSGRLACLAPLAGYSDAPLRLIAAECGADFAFTGLVSADGLSRSAAGSMRLLGRLPGEAPLGVQLFGADPGRMGRAAAIAAASGADFIDLNFGCPVKKVVRKNGGVSIMRDLDLMERIVRTVAATVAVPVTAKIRSGWSDEERNFLEAGRLLEACGTAAVTLHPRPRSQGFSGAAHWEDIASLREALAIPVIANGDIRTLGDYETVRKITGCSLVMIGRGALGNPWLFREIKDAALGRAARETGIVERLDTLERHLALTVEFFGEDHGVREMRKFYRWYVRSVHGIKKHRTLLVTAPRARDVAAIIAVMREELDGNGRETAREAS